MAVAAFAAVVSLMHVIDQIQQYPPSRHRLLDRDQIKSLREKVSSLQDFLEVHSQRFYAELEGLARQIAEVAVEAEDIIDTHVVDILISQRSADESDMDLSFFRKLVVDDESEEYISDSHAVVQLQEGSSDKSDTDLSFSCTGIENAIKKIDLIRKELMTLIKEGMILQEQAPGVSSPARASVPQSSGSNTMVGFGEHLVRIMDELFGNNCDLHVLPIVGMGGIGKTTLARNAFDNPQVKLHFDIRIWLTVSQAYSIHGILLGLLEELGDCKNEKSGESLAKLGEKLHKHLCERRYLIALDDVWSTEVWNYIRLNFPDDKNGSRIMVTTRLSNVAVSFGSNNPFLMNFLDKDQSWNLFCEKAFRGKGCPPKLERIGKNIAKSCKGLPLAIVIIGGLLSKSDMILEHWELVAKDVNSITNSEEDEHCLKLLSLSYKHLPIHLKPCFLYMRVFPEDHEIEVSKLIKLWVAEGFLEPKKDKILEEVAQEYLEDLIGRNLMICKLGRNGKVKKCGVHDLLRDLCIRESQNEQFNCAPKVQSFKGEIYETSCFLCKKEAALTRIDLPRAVVASQPTSFASCLVCDGCRIMYPLLQRTRLVKVLEYQYGDSDSFDLEVLHPTKLRVLHIIGKVNFLDNLSLLWNLQTLVIQCTNIILPCEIWELRQLRHLEVTDFGHLPDPLPITQVSRKDSTITLKNLQVLSCIRNFGWSNDAIERVPNLKTLKIDYYSLSGNIDLSEYSLNNLGHLHKLESLTLETRPVRTLENVAFPNSLKKLFLLYCNVPWEEITIIGSLPNLEVLKVYSDAFEGHEWNPVEGQFLRLKSLTIYHSSLARWGAEKVHFPNLEHLTLRFMLHLKQIPSDIGEIETLHSIHLYYCTMSAVNSAKEIVEEQHSLGNEDLQLYVNKELVLPASG